MTKSQLPPGMVAPVTPVTPVTPVARTQERRDIVLWKEAQTAPLHELMMAYSTITARLLDLVDETK